jgi:hypothetical protein
VKFIMQGFGVAAIVMFFGQLPAQAEGEFVKLSKISGNCKDGQPSAEAKFWFGGEKLAIEMEEHAAASKLSLARSEFSLYQQIRDTSYLEIQSTYE